MRMNMVFSVVGFLLLAGAGKLAWLEYARGSDLRQQAEAQQTASMVVPAQRGDILDARGRVLVGSIRKPMVFADPTCIADLRFAAYSLGPVLDLDPAALEKTLRERGDAQYVVVRRGLSDEMLQGFEQVCASRRIAGFRVQNEPARDYPYGTLAAHVLGFVQRDTSQVGLSGIEQEFERYLHGVDGKRSATVDRRRRRLRALSEQYEPPRDGATVVVTLDAHIQQVVEKHLREAVEKNACEWGTAVVMDPRSGEVLAMAVEPTFHPLDQIPPEPKAATEKALERRRNRAIADAFEPGSIFKPFVAAPALDAGLVRLDEWFQINGPTRQFGRRTIQDVHAYSTLQFFEVISKSSNIGMGMLGARVGNARLNEWVRNFGFGQLTGIKLPGESGGLLADLKDWGPYSTQSIPIGQEISVTPLQMLAAFCALCNDGVLFRPRIVRGVVRTDGTVVEDHTQPVELRRVVRSETAREFRMRALVETVLNGTGKTAAIPGYQVFGKTGTAQVAVPGRGYVPGVYAGSFVGGAPAREPRAVVLVTLYKPGGRAYYGGTISAPVAGRILGDVMDYLNVPPEEPEFGAAVPQREKRRSGAAPGGAD